MNRCTQFRKSLVRMLALGVLASMAVSTPAAAQQVIQGGPAATVARLHSIPSDRYFATFHAFNRGEYRQALKSYLSEVSGAVKSAEGVWIDSICYNTMAAECYYLLGNNAEALRHYGTALEVYLANQSWMILVEFPSYERAIVNAPSPRPNTANAAPWGSSTRNARLARYNTHTRIRFGNTPAENEQVVRQGGVYSPTVYYNLNVQEIVRCTTLAIRRRSELLGPLAASDELLGRISTSLARKQGPINHWAEVYMHVPHGVSLAAIGNDRQALTALQKGVLALGQYDHPLTGYALFELARMAKASNDFNTAQNLFYEASIAAYNFGDAELAAESLSEALAVRLATNQTDPYAPVSAAAEWARRNDHRMLQVTALMLCAQNAAASRNGPAALEFAQQARAACARSDLLNSRVGAQLNYVTALAHYQMGAVALGNTALKAALDFQSAASTHLFQTALINDMYAAGNLMTSRAAMEQFACLCRDPSTADWRLDPFESLTVMSSARPAAFENWFEVAIDRKDAEAALEIADAARRHQFLSTLPLGGRVHGLRWLLEGDDQMLNTATRLERDSLLATYPNYRTLAQEAAQIRETLKRVAPETDDRESHQQALALWSRLAEISEQQEAILHQMALSRETATILFPPLRATGQLQKALPPKVGILAFFSTRRSLYAFLLTDSKFGYWKVSNPPLVQRQIVELLHGLGNYDPNKPVNNEDLQAELWKKPARQLHDLLMADSRADLTALFDELVIVPDGALWYVPFEALQVGNPDASEPLISKMRIRYAPFASLAIGDPRPRRRNVQTVVAIGKLWPRDDVAVAQSAFEDLSRVLPGAAAVHGPAPVASSLLASVVDRLAVFNDLNPAGGDPYALAPIGLERAGSASTLADWFPLPWGAPEQIILPGFHSAAESGMRQARRGPAAGADLFLTVTGLMANGSQTVLISRWRTGGQSSYDLTREFIQELPHTNASDAWQRAIQVVSEQAIIPEREPRVLFKAKDAPSIKASHPFFWGAFMLVDTGPQGTAKDVTPPPGAVVNPAAVQADPPAPPAADPPPAAEAEAARPGPDLGRLGGPLPEAKKDD